MNFNEYDKVFTPASPISNLSFLFGREQEVYDLERSINRPGLHPIIIGNRGVGKTSLVHSTIKKNKYKHITITCNSRITFNSFALNLLRNLGYDINTTESIKAQTKNLEGSVSPFEIGLKGDYKEKSTSRDIGLGSINFDAWTVFEYLKEESKKYFIVLDEYDVIPKNKKNFHKNIAELIKTIGDNNHLCDSRIVVVGIARSAQALLGEHESIERNAREIFLRPLRNEDIRDFLSEAEESLNFKFERQVKERIVNGSNGYPYYVHLVGLECIDAMLRRDKKNRIVKLEDYSIAIKRSVNHAFRSVLNKYRHSVEELTPKEIQIIKEFVRLTDYNEKISRDVFTSVIVQHGVSSREELDSLLLKLQQKKRLIYISRNDDTIRFTEPLMGPFLRIWIMKQKVSGQLQMFRNKN